MQLSPHIKTVNQNPVTCWQVSVERVGLESIEAAEVEPWAAAQTAVPVSSKPAALHSQSVWCCHQRWDPKGEIQGMHFLERELARKPKLSVQVWWCSTCVCAVEMADMKFLRQKVVT